MGRLQDIYKMHREEVAHDDRDSRILIFDGLNTFIRIFAAVPSINDNGEHVGGIAGFMKSVAANIRQFSPTRCIIVFDGKGGSVRRKKLFPDYKAQRKNKTKLNRHQEFDNPEDARASMEHQLGRIIKYLDNLPVTYFAIDNIEADDSIACLVTDYYSKKESEIIIVSTDRDFLQLINPSVSVYNPVKKKLYNIPKMQEEYGIPPENYLLYRIIDGDGSDNIPGVKGVGLKTLIKEIPELTTTEIELDNLLELCAALKADSGKKPKKFLDSILNNEDILRRNYSLMQLNTSDIPSTSRARILDCVKTDNVSINHYNIKVLFAEDGLQTMVKDFDGWLATSFGKLNMYGKT